MHEHEEAAEPAEVPGPGQDATVPGAVAWDDATVPGLVAWDDATVPGPVAWDIAERDSRPAGGSSLTERVHRARSGLTALLSEADQARQQRAEATLDADRAGKRGNAVCAWNHFENIPTFYNWNNRPR